MKPRMQLKHALLRTTLPSQHKIRSLKRVHGVAGKCSLYEIYLAMSAATNAVIDQDCIFEIAEDNDVKDLDGYLSYCLEKGLIQRELDGYSNQPVIDDQEAYHARMVKLDEDAERKRLAREQERLKNMEHPPSVHGQSTDIPPDSPRTGSGFPVYAYGNDNDLDPNNINGLVLPGEFNTPEIRGALTACVARLKLSGRTLDQIMLDAKIMELRTSEALLGALRHTAGLSKTRNIITPTEKETKRTTTQSILEMGNNLKNKMKG